MLYGEALPSALTYTHTFSSLTQPKHRTTLPWLDWQWKGHTQTAPPFFAETHRRVVSSEHRPETQAWYISIRLADDKQAQTVHLWNWKITRAVQILIMITITALNTLLNNNPEQTFYFVTFHFGSRSTALWLSFWVMCWITHTNESKFMRKFG